MINKYRFFKNKGAVISLLFLLLVAVLGIFAPLAAPHDPLETDTLLRFAPPSLSYPLGNDQLGRCVLSRLIYGIRPSFLLVIAAMAATILIGAVLGILAGYFGGTVDAVIMRLCDICMSFPSEVMTLAVVGLLGVGLGNILLAYILFKWAWYARMIRTAVRQYLGSNYVLFAKAEGFSQFHIIRKHILPSVLSEIILISSSTVSSMILLISGFSFLGLGIQAPTPEWGTMLSEAKEVMTAHPYFTLPPGIAVMLVSVMSAVFSDCMRDVLDPQHMRRGGK